MDSAGVARQLQSLAAELDQVSGQVRELQGRVRTVLGSSATGADRRMLAGLSQVSGSTRGAQQALSAAATALRGTAG